MRSSDYARREGTEEISHRWAEPMPEVGGLITGALVIFPWDREIDAGGRWQPNPELENARRMQARK